MSIARSTPKEAALPRKLDRLPVFTRRTIRLRQFDFPNGHVLCWIRGVARGSRRYTMVCDAHAGVPNISFQTRRRRMPGRL